MFSTENPFKKVGVALLVIGVLDIILMIYCIINQIGYSSSFNIFAVIVSILLLKGSVKTARIARWLSIFFFTMFIGGIIGASLLMPFDLLKLQIKLNTWSAIVFFLFMTFFLYFMIWIYRQLSSPHALRRLAQAGYATGRPLSAYLSATFLFIFMIGMLIFLQGSESEKKAKEFAQQKLGSGFQYYVSSISFSENSGQANVVAYSDKEIRNVQVSW